MDLSLLPRAARASFAGSLLLAWGLVPAFAHPLGAAGPRPAAVGHWGVLHGWRAFNGRGHVQADRREAFAHGWAWRNGWSRNGWAHYRWGRNDWGRYGRGRNGWAGNGGRGYGDGVGYWDGPLGYAEPAVAAGGGPPVVFAPAITVYAPAAARGGDAAEPGGCVIHKLEYDAAGNYVGEKQYPQC